MIRTAGSGNVKLLTRALPASAFPDFETRDAPGASREEAHMRERRNRPRTDLAVTATLMCESEAVGRYTVQNLSAGGALLTGTVEADENEQHWILLELPTGPLSFEIRITRQARSGSVVAIAIAFEHASETSEDQIQDAVLHLLDARFREGHPAVVVVDPDAYQRASLVASLREHGRRTIECEAPLNAMQVLSDPAEHVHAVVMRDGPDAFPELLQWVAETRNNVRPILLVQDRQSDPAVSHAGVRRCFPEHLDEHLR